MNGPDPPSDSFEEAFSSQYPNPDRVGCPGERVLRGLASKKLSISHPARMHIGECSPCWREFRVFEADIQRKKKRLIVSGLRVGAVAALLLIVLLTFVRFRHLGNREQDVQAAMLNFATSIDRGVGSERRTVPGAIQAYPRKVLLLTMSLPPGSENGPYDFQVVSPGEKAPIPLMQSQSKAQIVNGLTTIIQKVDFSRFEAGIYIARVKHPPFGQWREVPIRVE